MPPDSDDSPYFGRLGCGLLLVVLAGLWELGKWVVAWLSS